MQGYRSGGVGTMVSCRAMQKAEDLALYYFDGCPWCTRVQRALDHLGVQVEMRNILRDRKHQEDLVAARGRRTVPVLRIRHPDGRDEWMPESADIVAYLIRRFGADAKRSGSSAKSA